MTIDTINPTLAIAGAITLFALSASGSAIGTGIGANAAVGAWKKCYAHNRPAPFTLLVFVGMPLTNTLYGLLLMNSIITKALSLPLLPGGGWILFGLCIFVGLVMGLAAWVQARAAACACDAQGETGQGFGNYIGAIGIIEGVTIFIVIFALFAVGKFFLAVS